MCFDELSEIAALEPSSPSKLVNTGSDDAGGAQSSDQEDVAGSGVLWTRVEAMQDVTSPGVQL